MTKIYFILSVVGWAWLVLVGLFLIVRLTIKRKSARGFVVVPPRSDVMSSTGGGGNAA